MTQFHKKAPKPHLSSLVDHFNNMIMKIILTVIVIIIIIIIITITLIIVIYLDSTYKVQWFFSLITQLKKENVFY